MQRHISIIPKNRKIGRRSQRRYHPTPGGRGQTECAGSVERRPVSEKESTEFAENVAPYAGADWNVWDPAANLTIIRGWRGSSVTV